MFKMKSIMQTKILIVIVLLVAANGLALEISSFVNDYAEVISPEYEEQISEVLQKLYDSNAAQFSIVTVKSLDGQDIESYALSLAQGRLGGKEKDNGLLLLVAVDDRKYRFEIGRGIEPILNDARAGRIARDYMVENFKAGEYGKGIYEAVVAVNSIFSGDEAPAAYAKKNAEMIVFVSSIISLIILMSVIGALGRRRHHNRDKYFDAAIMAGVLFGGRGKGGFGGGGFGRGGFGGGGFGGGGASGGW